MLSDVKAAVTILSTLVGVAAQPSLLGAILAAFTVKENADEMFKRAPSSLRTAINDMSDAAETAFAKWKEPPKDARIYWRQMIEAAAPDTAALLNGNHTGSQIAAILWARAKAAPQFKPEELGLMNEIFHKITAGTIDGFLRKPEVVAETTPDFRAEMLRRTAQLPELGVRDLRLVAAKMQIPDHRTLERDTLLLNIMTKIGHLMEARDTVVDGTELAKTEAGASLPAFEAAGEAILNGDLAGADAALEGIVDVSTAVLEKARLAQAQIALGANDLVAARGHIDAAARLHPRGSDASAMIHNSFLKALERHGHALGTDAFDMAIKHGERVRGEFIREDAFSEIDNNLAACLQGRAVLTKGAASDADYERAVAIYRTLRDHYRQFSPKLEQVRSANNLGSALLQRAGKQPHDAPALIVEAIGLLDDAVEMAESQPSFGMLTTLRNNAGRAYIRHARLLALADRAAGIDHRDADRRAARTALLDDAMRHIVPAIEESRTKRDARTLLAALSARAMAATLRLDISGDADRTALRELAERDLAEAERICDSIDTRVERAAILLARGRFHMALAAIQPDPQDQADMARASLGRALDLAKGAAPGLADEILQEIETFS